MAIIGPIGLIGIIGMIGGIMMYGNYRLFRAYRAYGAYRVYRAYGNDAMGDLLWIVSSVDSCFVHLLFNASVPEKVLLQLL